MMISIPHNQTCKRCLTLDIHIYLCRFTMYNDTVSPEVSCLLEHYTRTGVLTLLPWRLDLASQKEIRTEGLFAALNDCLCRNMGRVQYLVMMDLDELIIPYQVRNTE